MPQPGMPDFAAMSKEASTALQSEPAVKATKTVPVARSENSVPPAEVAAVSDAPDFVDDNDSSESAEIVASDSSEQKASVPDASVQSDKSQQQLEAEVAELPDNYKIKVKIDGEVTTITHGEYKDLIRKNATVTQRSQNLAESRKQFDAAVRQTIAELEARENALKQMQPKADPLSEALIAALKGQVAPKPRDAGEVLTYGELQAEQARLREEFEANRQKDRYEYEQSLLQAQQGVQEQAKLNRERQVFYSKLNEVLNKEDYKVLGEVIPKLSELTQYHIQSVGAQNLEEAIEAGEDFLKERLAVWKKNSTAAQQKAQATAAKQKMESNDGATPAIARNKVPAGKKFVGKDGRLDFKAMAAHSLATMNAME